MTRSVHLVGGGWTRAAADAVYGPFVNRCRGPIALIVEAGDGSDEYAGRFVDALGSVGAVDVHVIAISEDRRPTRRDFDTVTGVLVGGGLTPNYHALLVAAGDDWLPEEIPYLGFSAGAAIAPRIALIGGYAFEADGVRRAVSPEETSEDLGLVTTAPGLGLVPWTVDVHVGQWGTLARLLHVVAAGTAERGFAIDEDSALIVDDGAWRVAGAGFVYEIRHDADGARVCAHASGATGS